MLKIFKYFFIIIFITSCGYTPIYSNLKNKNINIQVEKINGNKDVNQLIIQKLSRYQNQSSEKVYNVKIDTNYEKLILAKNTAGNATNFRLNLDVKIIATLNGISKEFKFNEKFDMKKGDTIFEEEKYENIIINDMTNIIIQRFISQLLIDK
tara:strand:+ start:77 stop:532 length:456 start_codon:yes stop_codon:yes gene_type:complete